MKLRIEKKIIISECKCMIERKYCGYNQILSKMENYYSWKPEKKEIYFAFSKNKVRRLRFFYRM